MGTSYKRRPYDFKRRILKRVYTNRKDLLLEEQRYLSMIKTSEIKPSNLKPRYYNLHLSVKTPWHSDPDRILTIGQKISKLKKGKSTGPCSPEKAKAISEAKKISFAKRRNQTGSAFTSEHIENMRLCQLGKKHSNEWKINMSETLKRQWADGTRDKKALSIRMKTNNPKRISL
jgi:hypothetical protein